MFKLNKMRQLTYDELRVKKNLKEFLFSTPGGFRQFFVLGKTLKDAEKNFMRIDEMKRHGFTLRDLPIRKENLL